MWAGGKQERERSALLSMGSGKTAGRHDAGAESLHMNTCLLNGQGG